MEASSAVRQGGGFEGTGNQKSYSTGINYDHVFSPTFFTEARFGVAHLRNSAQPNDYGSNDATTLGIPGVNISGQPFTSGQVGDHHQRRLFKPAHWLLRFGAVDSSRVEHRLRQQLDEDRWQPHFKWGADVRRVHDDLLQDQTFSPRGAFTFSDVQTSDASAPGTTVANDIASFLLDQPSQTGRDLNTFFPRYRQWWFFAFASDKWQATPKLTVDLAFAGSSIRPPRPNVEGGFSNYNPTNNTLVLAGLGSNPSNLGMKTQYKYFAPRTGFAYRVSDDTVVRGGFGISYTPFPDNTYAYNYPIRANNSYQPVGASGFHSRRSCRWRDSGDVPGRFPGAGSGYDSFQRNHRLPTTGQPCSNTPGLHLHSAELQEPLRDVVECGLQQALPY